MPTRADSNEATFQPTGKHKLLVGLLWLMLVGVYVYVIQRSDLGPIESLQRVLGFLSGSAWGPLLFIGLYAIRPLFFFSASLLSVAGGLLFGPVLGVVFTIIGSNAGAALAYGIGRYFMRGASLPERLADWTQSMRRYSFETVFLLRVMYVPYDMVNYAAGLLRVRFVPFIAATMLGSLPGTLAFTLFGASAEGLDQGLPSFDIRLIVASAAIFVVSLVASRFLRKRRASPGDPSERSG